jgi:hypothetical protein
MLCQNNIRQLHTEIDVKNLPQTIRDAIAVNRKMSIPYLWVDALCIVQDDEVEKAKEISRMQDIYSCSAVTIIASSTSGADEGFLSLPEDTYLINPRRGAIVIPVRLAPRNFGTISFIDLNSGICYAENREPISRRAWTTQEQLLAQRKLIFTKHNHTMTWSCPHSPWPVPLVDLCTRPTGPETLVVKKKTSSARHRISLLWRPIQPPSALVNYPIEIRYWAVGYVS